MTTKTRQLKDSKFSFGSRPSWWGLCKYKLLLSLLSNTHPLQTPCLHRAACSELHMCSWWILPETSRKYVQLTHSIHELTHPSLPSTSCKSYSLVGSAGCIIMICAACCGSYPSQTNPANSWGLAGDHLLSVSEPQQATPTFCSHPKLSSLGGSPMHPFTCICCL